MQPALMDELSTQDEGSEIILIAAQPLYDPRKLSLNRFVILDRPASMGNLGAIIRSCDSDSAAKGKPDIELVDLTSKLNTINEILQVTLKPINIDGDTGGEPEHFCFTIRTYERFGVSVIIIEDKIG